MKKIILSVCLLSIFSLTKTQAQFATHIDTAGLTVSAYSNVVDYSAFIPSYNYTVVSGHLETPSESNTPYFFYSVRDFNGTHVKDTVFGINSTNMVAAEIKKTVAIGTNVYSLAAIQDSTNSKIYPAIINLDLSTGNITVKEISLDAMPLPQSIDPVDMIKTFDGNLLITLNVSYFSVSMAVVIKMSPNWSTIWSHNYSDKQSTNIPVFSEKLLQMPDSSFVMLGEAGFGSTAGLITHISNTGNVLSADTLDMTDANYDDHLSPQIIMGSTSNSDIYFGGVIFPTDTSYSDATAIINYDLSAGTVLWAKKYTSPLTQNITNDNIRISDIKEDNNNLLLKYVFVGQGPVEYYGIIQTDLSGSVLKARTYPVSPTSGIFTDDKTNLIVTPSDHGALLNATYLNMASQNSGNKTITIKTDDQLDANCGDSDITINGSAITGIQVNTFTYDSAGIGDTLLFSQVTTMNFSQDSAYHSAICNCNIQVSGTIDINSAPADSIKVYGYKSDTVPYMWRIVDSTITDATGHYTLHYLLGGKVIVKARPIKSTDTTVSTTFYNDTANVWQWLDATIIHTNCDSTYNNYNISMLNYTVNPSIDTTALSGDIIQGPGFGRYHSKQLNDPIPGIDVVVVDSASGLVAGSDNTDSTGHYHIGNLTNGVSYKVWCIIPGLGCDSTYHISFAAGVDSINSLNFYVDSDHIYIPNALGINEPIIAQSNNVNLIIYPNPAKEELNAKFSLNEPANVEISLTDILGRTVINKSLGKMSSGMHKENINLKNIHSGLYILKVKAGNDFFVKKLMKE